MDALALKGRHQEALALLRGARDGSHAAFGPGEVGPLQYHKVVLACKQGRQWALALDLLREMMRLQAAADGGGMQIMLHTYGAAMDACASAGQLDKCVAFP